MGYPYLCPLTKHYNKMELPNQPMKVEKWRFKFLFIRLRPFYCELSFHDNWETFILCMEHKWKLEALEEFKATIEGKVNPYCSEFYQI